MLTRYVVFACILVLASSLTACDNGMDAEDMLTQQEADALLEIIATNFVVSTSVLGNVATDEEPPDTDDIPDAGAFAVTFDTTFACSSGGSATVAGNAAPASVEQGDELALRYNFGQFTENCKETVDNTTLEVDIYYGVRQQGLFSFGVVDTDNSLGFVIGQEGETEGTLAWEAGDRSGVCDVDLSTDLDIDITLFGMVADDEEPVSIEGGTSGSICGLSVEFIPEVGDIEDIVPEADDGPLSRIAANRHFALP